MAELKNEDFKRLLDDPEKVVSGDIRWQSDEDHSPSLEFSAKVETTEGHPLFLRGSYNHETRSLSYVLILRGVGRIYALDIGKDHRNPSDGMMVGPKHKHTWSEKYQDKEAYVPSDITATVADPVEIWRQFCKEAGLVHVGNFNSPVPPPGMFSHDS